MKRGGTIYALTWGRDTTPETADRFAAMVDADWFITGHQPCDEGPPGQSSPDHHRWDEPYPAYCLFPAPGSVTMESLLKCMHIMDVLSSS